MGLISYIVAWDSRSCRWLKHMLLLCSNNAVAKNTPGCIPFTRYTQSALNAEREGFSIVGLFFGTYFVVAMLHCVWRVQERHHKATEAQSMLPFIPSTLRPAKNLAFRFVLVISFKFTLSRNGLY